MAKRARKAPVAAVAAPSRQMIRAKYDAACKEALRLHMAAPKSDAWQCACDQSARLWKELQEFNA